MPFDPQMTQRGTEERPKLGRHPELHSGSRRAKSWIPTPKANERIVKDDSLIVYGPHDVLKELLEVPTTLVGNEKKNIGA